MRLNNIAVRTVTFLAILNLTYAGYAADVNTSSAHSLSLREALKQAIENNPSLKEMKEKIRQSDFDIAVSKSVMFPNLSGTYSANTTKSAVYTGAAPFDGEKYNQYSTGLKLTQPLFQYGVLDAIESTKKSKEIAELNFKIAERNLSNNLIQAYYLVVQNYRNVWTVQEQVRLAKETVDVVTKRQKSGRAQVLDSLQARTQHALLEGQLSTAKNSLQNAIAGLMTLLGKPQSSDDIRIDDHLNAPTIADVEKGLDKSSAKILELELNKISIGKIDNQYSVISGQHYPNLSLIGNYNFTNYTQANLLNSESNSWLVGVQLSVPLFDGFNVSSQEDSLNSQKIQLEHDRQNLENQTSLQQIQAKINLKNAHDSIETGSEALKLAIASNEEAHRNFNLATIDLLQYLTVQNSKAQAEQQLNQYRYNYIVALSNYYLSMGQNMNHLVDLLEGANK